MTNITIAVPSVVIHTNENGTHTFDVIGAGWSVKYRRTGNSSDLTDVKKRGANFIKRFIKEKSAIENGANPYHIMGSWTQNGYFKTIAIVDHKAGESF